MKPRVIVFPLPIAGHIIPMLHLAEALFSQGNVAVTFVTTPRKQAAVVQILAEIGSSQELQQQIEIVTTPDGLGDEWAAGTGPKVVEDVMRSMMQQQAEFELLFQDLVARGPVACIISDFLMDWTQDVAKKFGVPRAGFWTSSSTYLLLLLNSRELFAGGFIPVQEASADEFIPPIRGVPLLKVREIPLSFHCENAADPGFEEAAISVRKQLEGADWIMANTSDALEEEANLAVGELTRHFITLGPLLKNGAALEERPAALEWLNNRRPRSVLYVSFGSLACLESLQQLQSLALGLEQSKQSVLWVIRDNQLVHQCLGEFLREFKARTSESCLVVPWAPQLQVLEHPAVGGFLTHCGWNSVVESIWTGVPMLGWPRMAEQNLNLKFVAEVWRIGLKLESLDSDDVSRSVMALMQGTEGEVARGHIVKLRNASENAARISGQNLQAFLQGL